MNESYKLGKDIWDRDDMIAHLKAFLSLYDNRPIRDNQGGQKAAHLFYSWYVAKKLKPTVIIESGVYKGQGTWAFENASPSSKIICVDPYLKNYEGYRSVNASYIESDFKLINWNAITDKSNVLCFFDDHQNALERIVQMKYQGFSQAMFEDNYPEGQGDCLSLKKVLEYPQKYQILPGLSGEEYLNKVIEIYLEFPPIFSLEKTRWGTAWNEHRTNLPLLSEEDSDLFIFKEEMDQYTWMNYVRLTGNNSEIY